MNNLDDKICQEFYCRSSGGGCGGYILVRLNPHINGVVEVVCPKCSHKHQRNIVDGVIKEQGRHTGSPTQEITPTMASWSEKSRMKWPVTDSADSMVANRNFLNEWWHERFGAAE